MFWFGLVLGAFLGAGLLTAWAFWEDWTWEREDDGWLSEKDWS